MSPSHRVVLFDFDLEPTTRRVLVDLPRHLTALATLATYVVKEDSR